MSDPAVPALLIVTLAALFWFQRNQMGRFAAFAAIEDTRRRQRAFLISAAKSCAFYLGLALIGLALLGRLETLSLWHIPREFWDFAAPLPLIQPRDMWAFPIGMAGGLAILGVVVLIRRRRPKRPSKPHKAEPLMARNGAEMLALLPLILNAAISEEVFFRLYIPLLIVLCGINAGIAFIATTLIFGALHRYQGWVGVLTTTVLGGVLAFFYLAGDGLWLPVAIHLIINLNSLLARPAIKRFIARRSD